MGHPPVTSCISFLFENVFTISFSATIKRLKSEVICTKITVGNNAIKCNKHLKDFLIMADSARCTARGLFNFHNSQSSQFSSWGRDLEALDVMQWCRMVVFDPTMRIMEALLINCNFIAFLNGPRNPGVTWLTWPTPVPPALTPPARSWPGQPRVPENLTH